MTKIYWLAVALFVLHVNLFAQSALSGVVVDSVNAPVPFAIVALHNSTDSSVVKGTPANEKGEFSLTSVSNGTYFIEVLATGFSPEYSNPFAYDSLSGFQLPPLQLHNAATMDAVIITTARPTIEFVNGNTVINVENSALAKGNSVFELLAKLPGVSIDKNKISIQGKSGVIVMIDGRVQYMNEDQIANLLRSMNAESVTRIEILRNPPSKYDAAGTSGMINIITKKNTQLGFSGSIYTSTEQGFYNSTAAGFALSYKGKRFAFFSSTDGRDGWFASRMKHNRYFVSDSGSTYMKSDNIWKERQSEIRYTAGCDWFVNEKTTVGIKVDGGPGAYTSYGTGSDSVFGYNDIGFDHLATVNYIPNKWNITNYNLNTERLLDTLGSRIGFSADYTNGTEHDKSSSDSHFFSGNQSEVLVPSIFQNRNNSSMQILSGKLDFTKTIDSASSFECGGKFSSVLIKNDYVLERKDSSNGNYYIDYNFSNRYDYEEQTYAAYAVYARSWKKLNVQLGFRAEETGVHGKNPDSGYEFHNDYFNLFPNLSFSWNVTDQHQLQLSVSRRTDRPVFDELNPFVYFQNPFSYYQGNPLLQPDYSLQAELVHSFGDWLVNSISFERVNRIMLDYTIQNDSTKIFLETNKNMNFQNALTYSLFIQRDIRTWWSVLISANAMYVEYNGDVSGVSFSSRTFTYWANTVNTFALPMHVNFELLGMYRAPNIYGTTQINPVWMASAALKKDFMDGKLSCSIGMNNIFNSMKFHTHAQFFNQNWDFYFADDSRRVALSVTYNFGTAKVNERDTNSNEEEKERLDL